MQSQPNRDTLQSIDGEYGYQQTLHILSKQNKPSKILCMLMNMLESYRQSKKMGWSRAWNKYGLITFQSFKLDSQKDCFLSEQALACLATLQDAPKDVVNFTHQLLTDSERLMGFLFFSEYVEDGQRYETVTLSFGRKVQGNARFRDRFDMVFDAAVIDGKPQALTRIRVYIDPYRQGEKEPLWITTLTDEAIPEAVNDLFVQLCQLSWLWQSEEDRHWDHWTSRYIDYFGERTLLPECSHFYISPGKPFSVDLAQS
ncbi:MAG: hypothetical protein R8M45_07595 [Ghiorsea sp.]